jgi:hypothetical protein
LHGVSTVEGSEAFADALRHHQVLLAFVAEECFLERSPRLLEVAGEREHLGEVAGRRRAVDQATQLGDAVRLAYCQPYVGAFFNFLLADESRLTGWRSGLPWSNWRPKPSYHAFGRAVVDVHARPGGLRSGWQLGLTARLRAPG